MAATVQIANPLREGLRRTRRPQPACIVLFGGSGDLARRKLMPSIYELQAAGEMPDRFAVIGFALTKRTREEFQDHIKQALVEHLPGPLSEKVWQKLRDFVYYISSDFDSDKGYAELARMVRKLNDELGLEGNVLFYLAIPPSFSPSVIHRLRDVGLCASSDGRGWTRIVLEKPFGHDLKSARELNELLAGVFDESQVYRVDHYMGKETVQNILVFRFANAIFEPVWNRTYIDHIQITAAESVGLEGRGDYYEEAGALRDMVQSHCMQLLSLVAMEPPVSFQSNDIRDEKVKALRAVRRLAPADVDAFVVRGQYGEGLENGVPVPGYRQEDDVSPTSASETYVALKLFVDNWRWQDVPFYIRTGKRLARKKTEIAIAFKPVAHEFFDAVSGAQPAPNSLVLRIQPNEGISLNIETKAPGSAEVPRSVDLAFQYLQAFGVLPSEAYERLLMDCMLGDQTLFARRDAVEEEWAVMSPILRAWEASPPPDFPNYPAGSFGPRAAQELVERDGRRWRRL